MRACGAECGGERAQGRLDHISKSHFTDPAERQGTNRNAELGCGDIGIKMLDRPLQGGSIHPPVRDKFRHAAAADSNEREFCRDENTVDGDEKKNGEYTEKIGNTAIGAGHVLLPCAGRSFEQAVGEGPQCRASARNGRIDERGQQQRPVCRGNQPGKEWPSLIAACRVAAQYCKGA